MIVRKDQTGGLIMVGQTEHSKMVGQFAAHWGNAQFAEPQPFDAVARAATFHDFGWLRYETAPIVDADGETPNFRDIPNNETRLSEYQWCVDWLLAPDPYASLIVNMHRTGLSRGRYGALVHPKQPVRDLPEFVDAFIARNEQRQAAERAGFDARQVRINYRLLQVWDQLGLYFGCQEPFEHYIEPVPTHYGAEEGEGVKLTLTPRGPRSIVVDPYPFDEADLRVTLVYKHLPRTRFSDLEDFRKAYFKAPTRLMEFELVGAPAQSSETFFPSAVAVGGGGAA